MELLELTPGLKLDKALKMNWVCEQVRVEKEKWQAKNIGEKPKWSRWRLEKLNKTENIPRKSAVDLSNNMNGATVCWKRKSVQKVTIKLTSRHVVELN